MLHLDGASEKTLHVYDVPSDVEVLLILLFINYSEEKVKSTHNRSRDLHVVIKRASSVVSSLNGISTLPTAFVSSENELLHELSDEISRDINGKVGALVNKRLEFFHV